MAPLLLSPGGSDRTEVKVLPGPQPPAGSTTSTPPLDFVLPPSLEAHEPPEHDGRQRDDVRLLVASASDGAVHHRTIGTLADHLRPGDLLVVNTSATLPAALAGERRMHRAAPSPGSVEPVLAHFATPLPGGLWLVELRRPTASGNAPLGDAEVDDSVVLASGGSLHLVAPWQPAPPAGGTRLWVAEPHLDESVEAYLIDHGRPIQYRHTTRPVGIDAYQSIFSRTPGSAEMPSAARPFTSDIVTDLAAHGVLIAPLLLHTGVSSLEEGEEPPIERYDVPPATAALVDHVHDRGGRVIAVGTTVVRALETTADESGRSHPGRGWTDTVLSPDRPTRVVDGLITGWHEPRSSHLRLLESVAGREVLERSYAEALAEGYRWHEFGDLHLILP